MSAPAIDEDGGLENLALPQLTPHSFASLPDAFCAALNAVSILLKVAEELYCICQNQQQKLGKGLLHTVPDLSARYAVPSEQKQHEQRQAELNSCDVSLVSAQNDDNNWKSLRRLESVLQTARLLNCNAEQYGHLLTPVQSTHHSAQLPVSEILPANVGEQLQCLSHASTQTAANDMRGAGQDVQENVPLQSALGGWLQKSSPSTRTPSRGSTVPDKNHIQAGGTSVPLDAYKEIKRRSRSKARQRNDYELSVCKALLMLQQVELHEETSSFEEEHFFTGERRQLLVDPHNYALLAPQREIFYDFVRKEVQEHHTPFCRHELGNSWQYSAGESRRHHQVHPRSPLTFQSVLAGGQSIRLDKRIILEMLLRIKVLQEVQRMLRADILMLRHQHFTDGQTLLLTLQNGVTKSGLERKALLSRLQKLAALLQNK